MAREAPRKLGCKSNAGCAAPSAGLRTGEGLSRGLINFRLRTVVCGHGNCTTLVLLTGFAQQERATEVAEIAG